MAKTRQWIALFAGAFASAFLLLVGIMTLILLYWPVLAVPFTQQIHYQPQLPLAEDREDEYFSLATERALAKQLYPSLVKSQVEAARQDSGQFPDGNWIRIPSIGVAMPLMMSSSMDDSDVLATLDRGAALYPNGITPGRLGNTFISAHSTGEPWAGRYRFAFLRINELEEGNLIHLDWQGTRYTYRVTGSEIVVPDDDFRVVSDRPVPTIVVMACWPLWSTDKRMLVRGELTSVTKLTPTPS